MWRCRADDHSSIRSACFLTAALLGCPRPWQFVPGDDGRVDGYGVTGYPQECPPDVGRLRSARDAENAAQAELFVKIARRDPAAFAQLYDQTSARVFGVAFRILRDRGFAEEVTQEVFLQAWRDADHYDAAKGSPVTWLVTLAQRRAVDRVRSESSNTNRELNYQAKNSSGVFDEVAEEVEIRWEHRAVSECLAGLSAPQRESLALAYYKGCTYREVSEYLSVPLPTVKSRIRDGLARLRACVGAE